MEDTQVQPAPPPAPTSAESGIGAPTESVGVEAPPPTPPPASEPEPTPPPPAEQPAPPPQQPSPPPTQPISPPQSTNQKANIARKLRQQQKIDRVLEFVRKKGKVTNDDIEKLLHVSDATASRYLRELVKLGKLQTSGKTKGAIYKPV